jgi:hypothetical protein
MVNDACPSGKKARPHAERALVGGGHDAAAEVRIPADRVTERRVDLCPAARSARPAIGRRAK